MPGLGLLAVDALAGPRSGAAGGKGARRGGASGVGVGARAAGVGASGAGSRRAAARRPAPRRSFGVAQEIGDVGHGLSLPSRALGESISAFAARLTCASVSGRASSARSRRAQKAPVPAPSGVRPAQKAPVPALRTPFLLRNPGFQPRSEAKTGMEPGVSERLRAGTRGFLAHGGHPSWDLRFLSASHAARRTR